MFEVIGTQMAGRQGTGMLKEPPAHHWALSRLPGRSFSSRRLYLDEVARNWAKTRGENRGPIWQGGC